MLTRLKDGCRRHARWLVAGLMLLGSLLFLRSQISGYISQRAAATATQVTGFQVRVESASLGLFSITLRGLDLRSRKAAWLKARAERVRLGFALLGWLKGRNARVLSISCLESKVELQFDSRAAEHAFDDFRQRMGQQETERQEERRSGKSSSRTLEVEGMDVRLRDRQGTLVSVKNLEATYRESLGSVLMEHLQVGQATQDTVDLRQVSLRAKQEGRTLFLQSLDVEDAALLWQSSSKDLQSQKPPRLIQRLRLLHKRLSAQEEGDPSTADNVRGSRLQAAPGFAASLKRGKVETLTAEGRKPALQNVMVHVRRANSSSAWKLEGLGRTGSDAKLDWNLRLWPARRAVIGQLRFEEVSLATILPVLPDLPWHKPEQAKLAGHLKVDVKGVNQLVFEGELSLKNAGLASRRIATEPVTSLEGRFVGEGILWPQRRRLELANGYFQVGQVRAPLTGAAEMGADHYQLRLDALIPHTSCAAVIEAIPDSLLGEFHGFQAEGAFQARLTTRIDSRALDETELDIQVSESCEFLRVPREADVRQYQRPFVHSIVEPDGELVEFTTGPDSEAWTPLGAISSNFTKAVLTHEDGGFYGHHGFYPKAIRDALVYNLKAGRYAKGASTISMQLVKNLFLHREKTLARKAQESVLTWWVEKALSKQEILELYLNIIEYGPGVYGIRQAARYYFASTPSALTPAQSVFLATMLPNPKKYSVYLRRGGLSETWMNRITRILNVMHGRGHLSDGEFEAGLAEVANFQFRAGSRAIFQDFGGSLRPGGSSQSTDAVVPHQQSLRPNDTN